ncbi:MAG TPA: AraC family transcriptional regulator, partial [Tissierellaceae bacterium]
MEDNSRLSAEIFDNNQRIILAKKFKDYRTFLSRIESSEIMVHEYLEIVYVVNGNVTIITEHEKRVLKSGDIYIISPNLVHRIFPENKDNIMLILQYNCPESKINLEKNNKVIENDLEDEIRQELLILLGNIYISNIDKELTEDEKEEKVSTYLNKICSILPRLKMVKLEEKCTSDIEYLVYEIIKKLPKMIEDDKDLGLDNISSKYNVSYSYLSRTFKKYTGENYTDYLLKIRMNKAVDYLINTNKKILDISCASGFLSVKTFNNTFKKMFNMSPSKFRQKYRDIEHLESMSPLYLDMKTQMFIEYIYAINASYRIKDLDKEYNINLKKNNTIIKDGIVNVLEIDYLFKSHSSIDNVKAYLSELKPDYLAIEIFYDGQDLYIVRSNKDKKKLSDMEFKTLIIEMKKNKVCPYIRLNYSEIDLTKSVEFYQSYYDMLENKITLLESIIGHDNLNDYVFEMYIANMKDYLISGENINNISNHVLKFKEVFEKNEYITTSNLGIYFGEISNFRDFNAMDILFNKVKKIDFLNFDIGLEIIMSSSIKCILNLLDDIKSYISKRYGDVPIITGFNYKIKSPEEITKENISYYNLFLAKLYIYLQKNGYILMSSSISYEKETLFKNYFTDSFGINQSSYYAYKLISSLKDEIIMIDTGIVVSKNKDEEEINI